MDILQLKKKAFLQDLWLFYRHTGFCSFWYLGKAFEISDELQN